MFNACRRGPASVSRILRATSTNVRIPLTRPSTLPLASQSPVKLSIESRWLHVSSQLRQYAAAAERAAGENSESSSPPLEVTEFADLARHSMVHPNVVNAITKGMGHATMTQVQTMTINQALKGDDIVAQARTGTGKTIGFLLPTIQNIIRNDPALAERKRYTKARASDIRAIIISPTRELAEQIGVEAAKLCEKTDLRVQIATGGNSKSSMLRKTQKEGCHLLVATPGRLNDLLTDPYSGIRAPKLTTLVLDEADRLLDDGFSKDIEDIIQLLPNRAEVDRQTLLFSATIPREVMHLVRQTLKPGFHFVQTVQEGDIATHEKVPQKIVTVPGFENYLPTLLELSKREIEKAAQAGRDGKPFKAIVYLSSTANVELSGRVFEELRGGSAGSFGPHLLHPADVSQIHGQLTQQQRTRVADRFRRAKSAILFSTDVTARGMDFPNVTHVIQIGLPPNQEQYIHRLGRTGRADKTGEGWLFISAFELREARTRLGHLPIKADNTLEAAKVDMTQEAQLPASLAATLTQITEATKVVDRMTKVRAYMAALGQAGGLGKRNIPLLNQWSKYGWGWSEPPAIPRKLAQKIGISASSGARIEGDRGSFTGDNDFDNGLNGPPKFSEGGADRGYGGGTRGGFGNRGGDRGGYGGRDGGRRDDGFGFGRQSSYNDRRGGGRSSYGRGDRGSRGGGRFNDPPASF